MDQDLIQEALRRCQELDAEAEGDDLDAAGSEITAGAFDPRRIPRRLKEDREIAWHRLDHRAAYLLKHVDGERSYGEIIGLSGVDAPSAVALFGDLMAARAIADR